MDPDKIDDGSDGAGDGKPDDLGGDVTEIYDQLAEGADAEDGDGKPEADDGSDDGDQQEQEAADAEAGDEQEDAAYEPPDHWSAEDKEAFAALPDEAKPLALDWRKSIETGYDTKFQEVAATKKEIEPFLGFKDVFAPYQQDLDRLGTTPQTYVRQLMQVATDLRNSPAETLARLARDYGVEFPAAQAEDEAGEDEFLDPAAAAEIRALKAEIAGLKQTTQNSLDQFTQANETERNQQIINQFNDFANTQADGKPKYPHAQRLQPQIGMQLQMMSAEETQGKSMNDLMAVAYERAAWSDADARAELLKAQTDNGQKTQKTEVQKAKKASRVAKPKADAAANVPNAPSTAGSWLEGVKEAYAELEAG